MKRRQRQGFLEQLKAVRNSGAKRTAQYEVQEARQDIIEEMPEEEYQKRVEENRKNKFIVDDFGLGYDDDGEVEFQADEDDLEDSPQAKKPKADTKLISSFMRPSTLAGKTKLTPKTKVNKEESLDIMKNLLQEIDIEDEEEAQAMDLDPLQSQKPVLISDKIKAEEERNQILATKVKPLRSRVMPEEQRYTQTTQQTPVEETKIPVSRKRLGPGKDPVVDPIVKEELATLLPDPPSRDVKTAVPEVCEVRMEIDPDSDTNMDNYQPVDLLTQSATTQFQDLTLNEQGQLSFYWFDAHEDREVSPGSIFLFGKVWVESRNRFESMCIVVREVSRVMFFQGVDLETDEGASAVYTEIEQIRKKAGIPEVKHKAVKRNYAFELPNVPLQPAMYWKIKYSGKYPPLYNAKGESFRHVFGARNTLLENLLVRRKMKGPCWLRVQSPEPSSKFSFCKYEACVLDETHISVSAEDVNKPIPPFTVLSLFIQTFMNEKNHNEIVCVSGVTNSGVLQDAPTPNYSRSNQSFSIVRKLFTFPGDIGQVATKVDVEQTEKALINNLMAKIQLIDPDVLIGHDLIALMLDLLVTRMQVCGCSGAVKLGRLNRSRLPTGKSKEDYYQGQFWIQRIATCGRLLCDTFLCTKELVKEPTYTLTHLAKSQLDRTFLELDRDAIPQQYLSTKGILSLVAHSVSAAQIPLDLTMKLSVIPLSKQLTNIAGNLWIRSLQQARAERNEMLLLHEFHKNKFICPDRAEYKEKNGEGKKKRANAYAGGLVLEPKTGLYDKYVMLLDFNSLYPSIIQEYNICFTTVVRSRGDVPEEEKTAIGNVPDKDSKPGILPGIIKQLVDRRRAAKAGLKNERDPVRIQQLDIKQRALKLTANSMYGCLGFKNSRFYAMAIAALITQQGRNTLEKAVGIVKEELHLDVIYGDTDSIMISTNMDNLDQAMKLGNDVKTRINKEFRCLEIDIDGVFQCILLYKKKKYASIKLINGVPVKEVKGLDMVRRDWCPLSKQISNEVLDIILSGIGKEAIVNKIHETLESFYEKLKSNLFPLVAYIITKQLTKPVNQYADIKSQPHVSVAKKMQERGVVNLLNHFVPYVICKGDDPAIGARAQIPKDVETSNGALEIDTSWYVAQQVLPPILRLCGVIEGTDSGRIASIFGQDPSRYQSSDAPQAESGPADLPVTQAQSCIPDILVKCDQGHSNLFSRAEIDTGPFKNGFSCRDPGHDTGRISAKQVQNRIMQILKEAISQFYQGWVKCEDPLCSTSLKHAMLERCPVKGCRKKLVSVMTAQKLHQYFYYFQSITTIANNSVLPEANQVRKMNVRII